VFNRRQSTAGFVRPIFADGVLGTMTACYATGTGGADSSRAGAVSQVGAVRSGRGFAAGNPSALTLPVDIISETGPLVGAASGGSSGGSGQLLTSGGTTYSRGSWYVPTTRRVRGTTISGTVRGGDTGGDPAGAPIPSTSGSSSPGGVISHSSPDFDIVFVEPVRAGEPASPVEVQLTHADGSPFGGPEKLARGCYYIVTEDKTKGVRLSRAFPWNSTAAQPHDKAARVVFEGIRKVALASGKPGMTDLPDLTGP